MDRPASPSKLLAVALSEWLLVLPPAVLLGAAALRLAGPRPYEPARTSWAIFQWATQHLSHRGAALLFLGLPLAAVVMGSAALVVFWQGSATLRQDIGRMVSSVRRHFAFAVLGAGTLLAAAILAAVLAHIITD